LEGKKANKNYRRIERKRGKTNWKSLGTHFFFSLEQLFAAK
jgi:predicted lipoprotein with Yx(FWY)xxD motif